MKRLLTKDWSLKRAGVLIALLSSNAWAALPPTVRVMVEREKQALTINGFDLVISNAKNQQTVLQASGKERLTFRCSLGSAITIQTHPGKIFKYNSPLKISSLGGFMRVGSNQYRDDLYIYSFNNDCVVVNHLDLEKYVAGLLNSEMNANWTLETLMAQAIAARTYAIYQMTESSQTSYKSLNSPFDLDSTEKDQVYQGAHQERYRALQAVRQTEGQILTFRNKPIKAFYHSTCGGKTENAEQVWGVKVPYIKSVSCGFCNISPRFDWNFETSLNDITERLKQKLKISEPILALKVLERNAIGRVKKVAVVTSQQTIITSGLVIRDLFGKQNIKSTNFAIQLLPEQNLLRFNGHGSGHGVGMCQWGAKKMGDSRYSYQAILRHYYPLAKLSKIY